MRVYIAGPYTLGDVAINVQRALDAGDVVQRAGHSPYIPHLSHFRHIHYPRPWKDWVAEDMVWLRTCEALIRLPGLSQGADIEVEEARHMEIPVYYGVDEFLHAQGRPL